jgi:hypothetical protein
MARINYYNQLYISEFLFSVGREVVGRQLQRLGNRINFAVVGVKLIEFYSFRVVYINEFKDCQYFVLSKGVIQPFHNLLKLLYSQLSTLVRIVCRKGLIECKLLGGKYFVQFNEALLDLELQIRGHFGRGKILLNGFYFSKSHVANQIRY